MNSAFQLASKDKMTDVAYLIRDLIKSAHKESTEVSWPPTADDLRPSEDLLPESLRRFLNLVISGDPSPDSEKTKRLVMSIGQDLCRSVTNSEWRLPKHILLCMALRHMYRSKQLTTILNRLGHCESYDFGMELSTALANALEETSTLLTPQIVYGEDSALFHSDWDNYNQLLTGIHGNTCINASAGIMIQETKAVAQEPSESLQGPKQYQYQE